MRKNIPSRFFDLFGNQRYDFALLDLGPESRPDHLMGGDFAGGGIGIQGGQFRQNRGENMGQGLRGLIDGLQAQAVCPRGFYENSRFRGPGPL